MSTSTIIKYVRSCAVPFLSALVLTCLSAAPATASDYQELGAIGKWKLTAALDGADITSLDEHEARQLLGRVFTISKDHVRFGKRDCGAPELTAKLVEPSHYLRQEAHASAELLKLPNPVTVVELGCTIAFIKNPHTIVLLWKGWFFDAKRVR
ncbi:MAG: hypothetical protein M3Y65_16605 [Pseudomonadota bacterium]|nr:hypothetical protein [Pseudomonadota bacterium]